MVESERNGIDYFGEQRDVMDDDDCLGMLTFQTRRLGVNQRMLDGIKAFTRARSGILAKDMVGNPLAIHGAVSVKGIRTEFGDNLRQRHSPRFDDLAGQAS